jgi:DNA replication protein DnaC
MKPVEEINPLIAEARRTLENKMKATWNRRFTLSGEEFKELFLIKAKEVMFDHKMLGEYVIDDSNRDVLSLLYYYAMRDMTKINSLAGIILNGAFGCGKSVMISAFCKLLNDIKYTGPDKIEEIHAIELAEHIRLKGVLAFSKIPLLIQDLGKEPNMINAYGTVINPISNLLAIRAEYGSVTYGSTNMDKKMFSEHYKEFITKRIVEHVNLVYLPGKSRRPDYSINQK